MIWFGGQKLIKYGLSTYLNQSLVELWSM